MKELFVVIYGQLLGSATCEVFADDIEVTDDGIKLFDGLRCIAYFSNSIFRGVYRKVDAKITVLPEESEVQQSDD